MTKNCCDQELPDDTKSQKNIQNLFAMSQAKDLIIENGSIAVAGGVVVDKVDKDEKELMKASQEINRSNRKLIKQSFNSNVLEIETESEGKKDEAVNNNDDDDWDTL